MLDEALQKEIMEKGRAFLHGVDRSDPVGAAFISDQEQGLPQPPLVKAAMTPPEDHLPLPAPDNIPLVQNDLTTLLLSRRSRRGCRNEPLTLPQLSYLLWATQGVTGIRAHRTILMDVGHVGQNLYLAATAMGLGACGVAAFDGPLCSHIFHLDDTDEFMIYAAAVGTAMQS